MKKVLRKRLAVLLDVNVGQIEIIKPSEIMNGLGLEIKIYDYSMNIESDGAQFKVGQDGNNREQEDEQETFEDILKEANENKELCKIFKDSWRLSQMPRIINIQRIFVKQQSEKMVFEMIATNSTKEPEGRYDSVDLNFDNVERWDRSSQDRMVYTGDTAKDSLDTVEEDVDKDLIHNQCIVEDEENRDSASEEP